MGAGLRLNEPGDSELQGIAVQNVVALEPERKRHFLVSFADSLLWKYRFGRYIWTLFQHIYLQIMFCLVKFRGSEMLLPVITENYF